MSPKAADVPDLGPLLPPQLPEDCGKKTLVLDLDETLIHT
jgi:TFIIF-interacting CTD phosphatase-like protein